jgi:hypothetical protein
VSEQRDHGLGEDGQRDQRESKPASDPVADFQRWLMRAGAKSMAHQVADNVRRSLGQQQSRAGKNGDIWDTATTEPSPDEPLECQWCPVCQAARRLRESGPGLGSKVADVGGVLASVAQDAFTAFDQFMKTSSERPAASSPREEREKREEDESPEQDQANTA